MAKITLYHGSPNETLVPTYGKGEEKHDYGRGFYLTPDIELAESGPYAMTRRAICIRLIWMLPIWISWILISTTRRHRSRN